MARIDAMTMKMDAQYKEFQSRSKPNPDHNDDDTPMSREEEEAKFTQTFRCIRFYNDYRNRDSNRDNWRSNGRNNYNRDNYQSYSDDKRDLQKQLRDFIKAQQSTNSFVKDTFMDLKTKLETTTKNHQARSKISKLNLTDLLTSNLVDLLDLFLVTLNLTQKDKDDESTPQPKNPKPVKENLTPKPYKPKIPYPQCLRKEKMEAQYGKFLDMIRAIRINVPLVNVLTRMPNYGKFLKELVSNKHKLEQILAAFLSDESFALIQNSTKLSHVML
ncbi:hypothetical protein Tco_1150109 [Tanacetum coccineum]